MKIKNSFRRVKIKCLRRKSEKQNRHYFGAGIKFGNRGFGFRGRADAGQQSNEFDDNRVKNADAKENERLEKEIEKASHGATRQEDEIRENVVIDQEIKGN